MGTEEHGVEQEKWKEALFDRLGAGKEKSRNFSIFGAAIKRGEGSYGYNQENVVKFYADYPNVESFLPFALSYLASIERHNTLQKRQEYELVMQKFIKAAFGIEISTQELKSKPSEEGQNSA